MGVIFYILILSLYSIISFNLKDVKKIKQSLLLNNQKETFKSRFDYTNDKMVELKAICEVGSEVMDDFIFPVDLTPYYTEIIGGRNLTYMFNKDIVVELVLDKYGYSLIEYKIKTFFNKENETIINIEFEYEKYDYEGTLEFKIPDLSFPWVEGKINKNITIGFKDNIYSNCNFIPHNQLLINKFKEIYPGKYSDHIDKYIPFNTRTELTLEQISNTRHTEYIKGKWVSTTIIKENKLCRLELSESFIFITVLEGLELRRLINNIYAFEYQSIEMIAGVPGQTMDYCDVLEGADEKCTEKYRKSFNIAGNGGLLELYHRYTRIGYDHSKIEFDDYVTATAKDYPFCYENVEEYSPTTGSPESSESSSTTPGFDGLLIYSLSYLIIIIVMII